MPLLVYSGAAARTRAGSWSRRCRSCRTCTGAGGRDTVRRVRRPVCARATELGVAHRVHVTAMCRSEVAPFLARATSGVIPIRHFPNHEIALITKFFEYSHARLPIVVSDVQDDGRDGPPHRAGRGLPGRRRRTTSSAPRQVLADPERYRAAYDKPGLLEDGRGRLLRRCSTRSTRGCAPTSSAPGVRGADDQRTGLALLALIIVRATQRAELQFHSPAREQQPTRLTNAPENMGASSPLVGGTKPKSHHGRLS